MSRKKGGMSKRLRKQKAQDVFEQRKSEELKSMSDKELTSHVSFLKNWEKEVSRTYSGFPHIKEEVEKAVKELESRKKK